MTILVEQINQWDSRIDEQGPFDIIGDVHGCYLELRELVLKLGYIISEDDIPVVSHPESRKLIFLGDLVDRGPDSPGCLKLAMGAVQNNKAICIIGNHENKLLRKLKGNDVQVTHGLAETLQQLASLPEKFRIQTIAFIIGLPRHKILDNGNLVIAHAGLKESLQGQDSATAEKFAMYGETTGETDEFGLQVRYNWAADYSGKAIVVYGHTPVPEAKWLNRTICIDTGCVFGGKLTALRYPENKLVQTKAYKIYYKPIKPFLPNK